MRPVLMVIARQHTLQPCTGQSMPGSPGRCWYDGTSNGVCRSVRTDRVCLHGGVAGSCSSAGQNVSRVVWGSPGCRRYHPGGGSPSDASTGAGIAGAESGCLPDPCCPICHVGVLPGAALCHSRTSHLAAQIWGKGPQYVEPGCSLG